MDVTNNVMVREGNTISYTVKGTCCSLFISPDCSKMLDKGSPSVIPLEEANPLNKGYLSCKCKEVDRGLDTLSGMLERIKLVPFFFFFVGAQTHTHLSANYS